MSLNLDWLAGELELFAAERGWQRFHNPKNLSMALAAEAGELLEQFRWLTPDEAEDRAASEAVADEIADILIYLVRLASVADVDLDEAVRRKLAKNRDRYPPR